jgi:hypothetical protein
MLLLIRDQHLNPILHHTLQRNLRRNQMHRFHRTYQLIKPNPSSHLPSYQKAKEKNLPEPIASITSLKSCFTYPKHATYLPTNQFGLNGTALLPNPNIHHSPLASITWHATSRPIATPAHSNTISTPSSLSVIFPTTLRKSVSSRRSKTSSAPNS